MNSREAYEIEHSFAKKIKIAHYFLRSRENEFCFLIIKVIKLIICITLNLLNFGLITLENKSGQKIYCNS